MKFDKIAGHTGHFVLGADGAIISSGGDLENNESAAEGIINILKTLAKEDFGSVVEKISITYADHSFLICCWNSNIYVVKKNTVTEDAA